MYSLDWAKNVVKTYYQKHARVSYYLLAKGPYTSGNLAIWLARKDPKWVLFKKAVDILEGYSNFDPEESKYYTSVGVNGFSALDSILVNLVQTPYEAVFTAIGVYPTLKKQSLKARAAQSGEAGDETADRQVDLFQEGDTFGNPARISRSNA
jgi:hypothetical protein